MIIPNYKFFFTTQQKKRILNNFFSGFSTEGLQIITQIFFAPLMLIFWGIEKFGIWIFLVSIPSAFLIFNVNTLDASIQEITMFKSNKKYNKANEIFQNSIILVLINIILFSTTIFLFYIFFPKELSILNNVSNLDLIIIFTLLILSIYINLVEGILLSGIYSEGKLYIGYNISALADFFTKIFIALSGFFFDSLLYPAIIFFLFAVIKFLINFYYFKINVKNLHFSLKLISKKIIKKLLKLSIGHNSDIISAIIKNSGVIIILGIFYDSYIVGYVATIKTLFYFMPIRFFGKLSHIFLYEYANLFIKKKFNLIRQSFINVTKIILGLLIFFLIISFFLGPFIYNLWINNKYQIDIFLLIIIIFDVFFYTLRDSIITVLRSINKYMLLGVSELMITSTSVLFFYLALYFGYSFQYGFLVILIGSLISLMYGSTILFNFFKKLK